MKIIGGNKRWADQLFAYGRDAHAGMVGSFGRALLVWEQPVWSALLSFLVYALLASRRGPVLGVSDYPYYNYLADAFLHGQVHLRVLPPTTHDLVFYQGRYYLYWPPLPAILLAPFVALVGIAFSDILFTLLVAALNVALIALLLRAADLSGLAPLSSLQRAYLVLFFALGTVHLTLAPYGRIWFTGQLVGLTCVILAYLAAIRLTGRRAFFWTGLALAGALLTRNHLLLTGLWPAYWLARKHGWLGRMLRPGQDPVNISTPAQRGSQLLAGLAPILTALALLAAYNLARFGNPLEVGLDYHQMDASFIAEYTRYGPFSLHYLPKNLFYQYLHYPFPLTPEAYQGGSLFLLSPVFFAAFAGLVRRETLESNLVLFGTILLVSIPILLLMGTGWIQFGPRYTLDFTVPLLLLTAQGTRRMPVPLLALLTLTSIVHYVLGTIYLQRVV